MFGASGKEKVDVESLEKENDRGLDALSERVSLLKTVTQNIKNEADNHLSLLDDMDKGMGNTKSSMKAMVDKFTTVFNDKQNKKMIVIVVGTVCVLILLWYFTRR